MSSQNGFKCWTIETVEVTKPEKSLGMELEWQKEGFTKKKGAFQVKKVLDTAPLEIKEKVDIGIQLVSINGVELKTLKLIQSALAGVPVGGLLKFEFVRLTHQSILDMLPTADEPTKLKLQLLLEFGEVLEEVHLTKEESMGLKLEEVENDMAKITDIAGDAPSEVKQKLKVGTWITTIDENMPPALGVNTGEKVHLTILHPHGSYPELERYTEHKTTAAKEKYDILTNEELFTLETTHFSDQEALTMLKDSRLADNPDAESKAVATVLLKDCIATVKARGVTKLQQLRTKRQKKKRANRSKQQREKIKAKNAKSVKKETSKREPVTNTPPNLDLSSEDERHDYSFFDNEHLYALDPSEISDEEAFLKLRTARCKANPNAKANAERLLASEDRRIQSRNQALILLYRSRRERKRRKMERRKAKEKLFSQANGQVERSVNERRNSNSEEEEESYEEGVEVLSPQEKWEIFSKRQAEILAQKETSKKRKVNPKPVVVMKAKNAYQMFVEEKKAQYKEQGMEADNQQIRTLWQLLTKDEKAKFKEKAVKHNAQIPKKKKKKDDNRNSIVDAFLDANILDV